MPRTKSSCLAVLNTLTWYNELGIVGKCKDLIQGVSCESKTLAELKNTLLQLDDKTLKPYANNLVFSDGNPEAVVMFVGEGPGAEEDKQGIPFVGQSGNLLNQMLHAIGLSRNDVYITNIVPWRPPENRNPTTDEVQKYLPYVRKHIELVRPKFLICLGSVAAKALLNTQDGILKIRGQWLEYNQHTKIMATLHPAYLLRSGGQKALAWLDFLSLKERLL